jgi:hypothetical protein
MLNITVNVVQGGIVRPTWLRRPRTRFGLRC